METSHQKSGEGFTIIIFGFSKETNFTSTHSQTREIGHNIDALIVAITQRQCCLGCLVFIEEEQKRQQK
jgi:hypothetical protein